MIRQSFESVLRIIIWKGFFMKKSRFIQFISLFAVMMTLFMIISLFSAGAAGGTVYTCRLNSRYDHPVTGVIEDSGGESAFATGQGMVESCTYDYAILEKSDSGNNYLTVRMSLMDLTSGHSFTVQEWGAEGWQDTGASITQNGTDDNGATADICIQVPADNAVVRGTMYVEPMGRWVIWYMYASDFTEGNTTDMIATMVTEISPETQSEEAAAQMQETADAAETVSASTAETETVMPTAGISETTVIPAASEAEDVIPKAGASKLDSRRGLYLSTEKEIGGKSEVTGMSPLLPAVIGCCAAAAIITAVMIVKKHKRRKKLNTEDDNEEYDEEDNENA